MNIIASNNSGDDAARRAAEAERRFADELHKRAMDMKARAAKATQR
ncbi:hypothetical protein [Streptomyces sp. SID3343]|nr:hypothetical protein [Streptomyces sp. SID3343]MYW00386.1 hypothetical protein [Streptomyces sp. SID3343]MYW04589.1 hypothetical protein [Streptomyces sp. SID3343]